MWSRKPVLGLIVVRDDLGRRSSSKPMKNECCCSKLPNVIYVTLYIGLPIIGVKLLHLYSVKVQGSHRVLVMRRSRSPYGLFNLYHGLRPAETPNIPACSLTHCANDSGGRPSTFSIVGVLGPGSARHVERYPSILSGTSLGRPWASMPARTCSRGNLFEAQVPADSLSYDTHSVRLAQRLGPRDGVRLALMSFVDERLGCHRCDVALVDRRGRRRAVCAANYVPGADLRDPNRRIRMQSQSTSASSIPDRTLSRSSPPS